jgi:hypothetical protein
MRKAGQTLTILGIFAIVAGVLMVSVGNTTGYLISGIGSLSCSCGFIMWIVGAAADRFEGYFILQAGVENAIRLHAAKDFGPGWIAQKFNELGILNGARGRWGAEEVVKIARASFGATSEESEDAESEPRESYFDKLHGKSQP